MEVLVKSSVKSVFVNGTGVGMASVGTSVGVGAGAEVGTRFAGAAAVVNACVVCWMVELTFENT